MHNQKAGVPTYMEHADSKIDENVNTLAEKLKVSTTSTPKDSVSDEILDTAIKIFTYLCRGRRKAK